MQGVPGEVSELVAEYCPPEMRDVVSFFWQAIESNLELLPGQKAVEMDTSTAPEEWACVEEVAGVLQQLLLQAAEKVMMDSVCCVCIQQPSDELCFSLVHSATSRLRGPSLTVPMPSRASKTTARRTPSTFPLC